MLTMATKEDLINHHELSFDPGDPLNASLYVCTARGDANRDQAASQVLAQLRAAALWSDVAPKQVPDEHRAAYREQLRFVAAASYATPAGTVIIARFDHEKYPSNDERWHSWLATMDAHYQGIEE